MVARHAGYKFPYRHPAPGNLVEKALYGLGTVFRGLGSALDEIGALVQGPGAVKETGEFSEADLKPNKCISVSQPRVMHQMLDHDALHFN